MTPKDPIVSSSEPHGDALSWKGYVDVRIDHLADIIGQRITASFEQVMQFVNAEITRVENLLAAERDRAIARSDASDKATGVRNGELETRLASMNEFRAALNDFALRAATVAQLDNKVDPIRERLEKLEKQAQGLIDGTTLTSRLDPISALVNKNETQLIKLEQITTDVGILKTDVSTLKTRENTQTGKASGVQAVFATVVIVIVIAGFLFTWFRFQPKP